ncbi:alpha/beta hydrolase [Zhongshania sp.]|uniref:alpha/beta hydrolase n=1 Tax=Zhongshania sp. TaxID=1971902 RepID=UPI00356A12CC
MTITTHPKSSTAPEIGSGIMYRDIPICIRSRTTLWFLKLVLKPMMRFMLRGSTGRIAKVQLQVATLTCPDSSGLPLNYDIVGNVPGHVIGSLDDTSRPVVLWLHGGSFLLPAAPNMHMVMVAKICKQLGADSFLPDYRLAPQAQFPAGLNDCESAYRALLELGYPASKIILGGDSAGGNLALGLLQRIRKAELAMPVCTIAVSPVTEMGRIHSPPSRPNLAKKDPLLPISALPRVAELYAGSWDTADPELSPLYMDCTGLTPIYFLTSDNEILMDDTVMLAQRMIKAGVNTTCQIWPTLPHAFPLFEAQLREGAHARKDITNFAQQQLDSAKS